MSLNKKAGEHFCLPAFSFNPDYAVEFLLAGKATANAGTKVFLILIPAQSARQTILLNILALPLARRLSRPVFLVSFTPMTKPWRMIRV